MACHIRYLALLQVVPAALDLEATSLSGLGLLAGHAGEEVKLTVIPRDSYGNVWREGPLTLLAAATLIPFESSTLNDRMALPVTITSMATGMMQLSLLSEKVACDPEHQKLFSRDSSAQTSHPIIRIRKHISKQPAQA